MTRTRRPDVDHERTLSSMTATGEIAPTQYLAATLLWHPEPARIGEQVAFDANGASMLLSRAAPAFLRAGDARGEPLSHRCVSRTPIELAPLPDGGLRIGAPSSRMRVMLDGEPNDACIELPPERVARGVLLQLGGRVLLCLHRAEDHVVPQRLGGLVGGSSSMARVQRQIRRVANVDAPLLVLGETGTGKELVAQAVHALGARAAHPLVAVNMAALTETLAATDLFGAAKGAYTGAAAARGGLFAEADGGTLFLDEVGDTPAPIQPMLLRVLETGEYRPVGATRSQHADVRLIAATDRDLGAIGFNQPLRRRLEAFVIALPPLRERREDIGMLLRHFLHAHGCSDAQLGALPGDLVQALCLHAWPGNVRELRHVASRIALSLQEGQVPGTVELLGRPAPPPERRALATPLPPAAAYRAPSSVSSQEVLQSLERNDWCVRQAAVSLGVSRASFYALLDAHPAVRRAQDIPPREIEVALRAAPGEPTRWAALLRTPREALRRRVRELGLDDT